MAPEKESPPEKEAEAAAPAARYTVLVDLNVVVDVLQRREPHYVASARVWAAVEEGLLHGSVAAHSVTTLFYLLSRYLDGAKAIAAIRDLISVFSVAKVDEAVIRNALSYGWKDFEDAVQMAAAAAIEADYLVTRNPKDFQSAPIAVLEPAELPAILQAPS